MNAKILFASTVVIALLSSGAAIAADQNGPLTRAEVKAEAARALRADPLLGLGESYGVPLRNASPPSTLTRAEVRAEAALQPHDAGRMAYPELYSVQKPQATSSVSRAEVRAEARVAAHDPDHSRNALYLY